MSVRLSLLTHLFHNTQVYVGLDRRVSQLKQGFKTHLCPSKVAKMAQAIENQA